MDEYKGLIEHFMALENRAPSQEEVNAIIERETGCTCHLFYLPSEARTSREECPFHAREYQG